MYSASVHADTVNQYHPPPRVAKELVKHAIRNIPGKQVLLDKLYPRKTNRLYGLKPHEYNSGGKLQFAFQNSISSIPKSIW